MQPNADFDAGQAARRLLREARTATLATLLPDGSPYASLVTVASLFDGAPVLLLSGLARHTGNIAADPRVSLLLAETRAGDPLQGTRISLAGTIARTDDPHARRRFLARHPLATGYSAFADFAFYRIALTGGHLVAGFGRIVDLDAAVLATPLAGAEQLLAAEADAVAHMNEDHRDAIGLYATRLLGAPPGDWRIASLDPEGCDLIDGDSVRRLAFAERVTDSAALRKTLVALVKQAKAL